MNKSAYTKIVNVDEVEQYHTLLQNVTKIYDYAYNYSPWYKSFKPENSDGNDFRLQQKPLNKRDLQLHGDKLLTAPIDDNTIKESTSGSSGMPVTTYWTKDEYNLSTMHVWQARRRLQIKFSSNIVYLNGISSAEYEIEKLGRTQFRFNRIFKKEYLQKYVDFLSSIGPETMLYGHPSVIYDFSYQIKKNKIPVPRLRAVEVNGEMCEPYELEGISNILNVPVLNNYGCREAWPIALTCGYETMHVCNDLVFIESDEDHNLYVTSLIKKMQPLLKYSCGDLGSITWGRCKCGLTSQIIERLIGRKNDYIYYKDGRKDHWGKLSKLMTKYIIANPNNIIEYTIYQDKNYCLNINVIPADKFDHSALKKLLGDYYPEFEIRINLIQSIPRNKRGKRVYLKSDVPG